jgi:hypothetical protein
MSAIMVIATPWRKESKPTRDKGYLAFIRRQPCCVCGSRRGVQAAHTGPRGLSQRSSARQSIPLCYRDHKGGNQSYHALGPVRFAQTHHLDVPAIIATLNEQGLLFESPHAIGRLQRSPGYTRYHCPCGFRTAWYSGEHDALAAIHRHIGGDL